MREQGASNALACLSSIEAFAIAVACVPLSHSINPNRVFSMLKTVTAALIAVLSPIAAAHAQKHPSPTIPKIAADTGYPRVRTILIAAGWQPSREPNAVPCSSAYAEKRGFCPIERQDCSGTGQGFCRFTWRKDSTLLIIITADDPPKFNSAHIER
jgi:hypothetical protein